MCWDFYTETHPIARKEHKCWICGETIHRGERYSRESGKYDGVFHDDAVCASCHVYRDEYLEESGYGEYDVWEITDYLHDYFCRKHCDPDACENDELTCQKIKEHYSEQIQKFIKKV